MQRHPYDWEQELSHRVAMFGGRGVLVSFVVALAALAVTVIARAFGAMG